jgi:predicted nucleotide-binding protein
LAKAQRNSGSPKQQVPTIDSKLAVKRLTRLLEELPGIRSAGPRSAKLDTWEGNVKIVLSQYFGENSVPYREFASIWFSPGMYYDGQPQSEFVDALNSGLDQAKGFLESRISDIQDETMSDVAATNSQSSSKVSNSRMVFLVHGHDHGTKETIARFLEKLDLEPIILHEQPDQGRTIIEKFESHAAEARCAVVILTADDVGASKLSPTSLEPRARQNVILELGYFVGALGRKHTFALVEKGVAIPSDLHGLIYIPIEDSQWRLRLVKELKASGIEVDANHAF